MYAEALRAHLSAEEIKKPTQSSGFYYWPRIIFKFPLKVVAVRFKNADFYTKGCKLIPHRIHLAYRYFYLHGLFFFSSISCQYLKFGKYHSKMPDVHVLWDIPA